MHCSKESAITPMPLPTYILKPQPFTVSDDFKIKILSRLHDDAVGRLCRTDSAIVLVGQRLYEKIKRKQDKEVEVKKSVMADMRRLGGLYLEFKATDYKHSSTQSSADMIHRENLSSLHEAINKCTRRRL